MKTHMKVNYMVLMIKIFKMIRAKVDNKIKKMSDIKDFMKPGALIDTSQPSIQTCIQSKARWNETDMSLAL